MINFKGTKNAAKTTVASARTEGANTLDVADATVFDGSDAFPDKQIAVSIIRANELITILNCTGRTGNTLTGVSAIEVDDADCDENDIVALTPTSGTIQNIHSSIDALFSIQSPNRSTQLVEGGGVAWITSYQYRVSAATYFIDGVLYTSPEQTITLDEADITNDRFDVIALNTSSTVIKITGTPAPNPNVPDVDPTSQVLLTIVSVSANSTEPTISNNINIYLENTEWTSSQSGGTITLNSTNNPYQGTICIESTSSAANHYVQLQSGTTLDVTTKNTLVFYIRSKANWSKKTLNIRFQNAGTIVGQTITLTNNQYGFISTNTTDYQQIVIPISRFAIAPGTLVNQLRLTVLGGGSNIGFYLDKISLQVDATEAIISNFLTQSQADAKYLKAIQNLSDIPSRSIARNNLGIATTGSEPVSPQTGDLWIDNTTTKLYKDSAWQVLSVIPKGTYISRVANQSINATTATAIIWDTTNRDELNAFNIASPTRLTIPSTGWYLVDLYVRTNGPTNVSALVILDYRVNGSSWRQAAYYNAGANPDVPARVTTPDYLTAGDYIEALIYHFASGARNFIGQAKLILMNSVETVQHLDKEILRFALAIGADATTSMVTTNPLKVRQAHTLLAAWAQCDTAPTGANLILSIEKSTDGTTWTGLWASAPSNRPIITASTKISPNSLTFDSTIGLANTLYRAKIIQIGSTIPGKDITVELEITY